LHHLPLSGKLKASIQPPPAAAIRTTQELPVPTLQESQYLRRQMDRPLADLMAELALYAPAAKGPADLWQRVAAPVQQRLCHEWGWCDVRQDARFENDYDLAIAVFTVLSTRVLDLPIDVDLLLITAIVVKRGLDGFCNCL
jgi:hypothetical protein